VLRQLTQDHSLAAQAAGGGSTSHILLNCLGGGQPVEPEVSALVLCRNDVLLLCTDGLTEHLDDGRLGQHLCRVAAGGAGSVRRGVEAMVAEAIYRGGTDNVTAVVGRF
jgi:protein phosphatase